MAVARVCTASTSQRETASRAVNRTAWAIRLGSIATPPLIGMLAGAPAWQAGAGIVPLSPALSCVPSVGARSQHSLAGIIDNVRDNHRVHFTEEMSSIWHADIGKGIIASGSPVLPVDVGVG